MDASEYSKSSWAISLLGVLVIGLGVFLTIGGERVVVGPAILTVGLVGLQVGVAGVLSARRFGELDQTLRDIHRQLREKSDCPKCHGGQGAAEE